MRLIDADKFKDCFNTDTAIGKTMRLMIDEQPTVFDIDLTIKQLEEKANTSTECWKQFDDESAFGEINAYSTSINIVKSGFCKEAGNEKREQNMSSMRGNK